LCSPPGCDSREQAILNAVLLFSIPELRVCEGNSRRPASKGAQDAKALGYAFEDG
jgi:hypothetical protein